MGNTVVSQLILEIEEALATVPIRASQLIAEIDTTGRYQGATALPTVETDAASLVGQTTARLNGEVTASGGEAGPRRAFDWDDVALPAVSSIPATSTSYAVCRLALQRSGFYAAGRFWLFYVDGTNFCYKSSVDNTNWSDAVVIRALGVAAMYSIFFDGTYVHYACNSHGLVGHYYGIYYRRGTPQANGSINWSAAEQTALATDTIADDVSLAIDSNGCAWIGYATTITRYPSVTSSTANDGTWSTRAGFPQTFFETMDWFTYMLPMTLGRVAAIVFNRGSTIRSYIWGGAAWGDQEVATTSALASDFWAQLCGANIGDDLHIVFQAGATDDIRHVRRTGEAWGSEAIVVPAIPATILGVCTPALAVDGSDLWCFWEAGTAIRYKRWTGGVWDWWPSALLQDTFPVDLDNLECYFSTFGGYLCLSYLAKTASPYDITHVVFKGPFTVWSELLENGVGTYYKDLEGLSPGVTYYFRAWAQNTMGKAYGVVLDFTTETPGLPRSFALIIG